MPPQKNPRVAVTVSGADAQPAVPAAVWQTVLGPKPLQ
jgi:hypothetical protein